MIHIYPNNDIKEHILEGVNCPCEPKITTDGYDDVIIIHNSFDGREGVEWANEILNN